MRTLPLAALALACALHGVTHAARPGDLDPSFGQGGTARVPVPLGDVVSGGVPARVSERASERASLSATPASLSLAPYNA